MTTELTVEGMTCEKCEEVVEEALEMADGVESAEADRYDKVAIVEGSVDDIDSLIEQVELAGYEASE